MSGGRAEAGDGFTAYVAREARQVAFATLSPSVRARVRLAVLDWLGVTIAGSAEPSARIMRTVAAAEGGAGTVHVIGTASRMSATQAVLCNGVAGHALDFDDCGLGGHPSVPVLAAVFALADELGAGGPQVIEAAVAGYEATALLNAACGSSAYLRGFHTTGTLGAFGAAAGCGRLLGLPDVEMQRALGLAATQAAGLKASFGTMGKHLNAAKAAANGLLAARLAQAGFTGATDAVESPQGFAAAHNSAGSEFGPERAESELDGRRGVEMIFFKPHASCAGTHSAIESIRAMRAGGRFSADQVADVELRVALSIPDVCGIPEPRTGLEGKFSIRHAAALAVAGADTGPGGFTDERVRDPRLVSIRDRIRVVPTGDIAVGEATSVTIRLAGGEVLTKSVNPNVPAADDMLDSEWDLIQSKFTALTAPVIGSGGAERVIGLVGRLHSARNVADLLAACCPPVG